MTTKNMSSTRRGRKSLYREEYAELAFNYAILGAIDDQLADFFGVTDRTIRVWKKRYSEFSSALKKGKARADAEIAHSLFHRACGYKHPDVDIRVVRGEIVKTDIIKHYPPDTAACIFWLKNRQPSLWRNHPEENGNFEDILINPNPEV